MPGTTIGEDLSKSGGLTGSNIQNLIFGTTIGEDLSQSGSLILSDTLNSTFWGNIGSIASAIQFPTLTDLLTQVEQAGTQGGNPLENFFSNLFISNPTVQVEAQKINDAASKLAIATYAPGNPLENLFSQNVVVPAIQSSPVAANIAAGSVAFEGAGIIGLALLAFVAFKVIR